jgi:hypothetical protein
MVRQPFSFFNFEPIWIIWGKYKTTWALITASRPGRRPDHTDRLRTAATATLPAPTASPPPFPTHRSHRHVAIVRSCPASAPPRVMQLPTVMPCSRAPAESTTSLFPGRTSFCSFLHEKAPRTAAAAAIPWPTGTSHRQASPAALPRSRHHPNNCPRPGHLLDPRAANHHHRTPPLTDVPLRPSHAPMETTSLVSPPL